MRKRMTATLLLGLAVVVWYAAPALRAQDGLEPYLTADGKLAQAVEVRDERQRGTVSYGVIYRIAKDGSWTMSHVRGFNVGPSINGKLKPGEVRQLAQALASKKVAALTTVGLFENKQRRITVRLGDRQATLTIPLAEKINPARPAVPSVLLPPRPETVAAFTGIVDAVKQILDVDPVVALYLTPDGKLAYPLEVREEKAHVTFMDSTVKGPAFRPPQVDLQTFYGVTYRVEVDGKWTATQIYRKETLKQQSGQIDLDGMKSIASALEEAEVDNIKQLGTANVNHHLVSFRFGPYQGLMWYGVDLALARPPGANAKMPPEPNQPGTEAVRQVSAIVETVKGLVEVIPDPPTLRVLGPKDTDRYMWQKRLPKK